MSPGANLVLMGVLFLGFGYMGVPVSFALMAGVFVATAFTPVSLQSMVGQLFHGIDSETLLAVPFFLLVGELMASSDVVHRMIRLSQTLVGHLRGGCLAGVVPAVLIGTGLMTYSCCWGPVGVMKQRAPFTEVVVAARGAALPLIIPVIIMGGILTGWFTPTEAGMIAAVYILIVLIPALNRDHIKELPRDFMYAGLLYSLPLGAVAGASAFGWMVAFLRGPDIVA